jgi:hypothetical protein
MSHFILEDLEETIAPATAGEQTVVLAVVLRVVVL